MKDCGEARLYKHPHDAVQWSNMIYMNYTFVMGGIVKLWIHPISFDETEDSVLHLQWICLTTISAGIYLLRLYTPYW